MKNGDKGNAVDEIEALLQTPEPAASPEPPHTPAPTDEHSVYAKRGVTHTDSDTTAQQNTAADETISEQVCRKKHPCYTRRLANIPERTLLHNCGYNVNVKRAPRLLQSR